MAGDLLIVSPNFSEYYHQLFDLEFQLQYIRQCCLGSQELSEELLDCVQIWESKRVIPDFSRRPKGERLSSGLSVREEVAFLPEPCIVPSGTLKARQLRGGPRGQLLLDFSISCDQWCSVFSNDISEEQPCHGNDSYCFRGFWDSSDQVQEEDPILVVNLPDAICGI